jgi:hypothetical protein
VSNVSIDKSLVTNVVLGALLGTVACIAHAQTPPASNGDIGVLDGFKGSVMVLKDKDYVNAAKGMKLSDGDRVMVLDKSQATVIINARGQRCQIDLTEDQSFIVRDRECRALLLTVQTVPVGTVPGGVVASAAPVEITTGALVGVGIVGVGAIYGWHHPKASSD